LKGYEVKVPSFFIVVLYFFALPEYPCAMNHGYIRLCDVLNQMDQIGPDGKPSKFQIRFVTADRSLGIGGEIIELFNCCKCVGLNKQGSPVFDLRTKNSSSDSRIKKDPHHWINATRNILLENGKIRKVHIRLIIEFNNQKVCY